jgi:uncharacterized protein YfaS (alpha-2-macroglobulin family)
MIFQRNETVICSITVKTAAGVLTDPITSVTITITNPAGTAIVTSANMTKDSTGTYHYDYNPVVDAALGNYDVHYIATDGSRITIQDDNFSLS